MMELVFVACLATAPEVCAERSLLRLAETGLTGCMVTAQAQLAEWSQAHPKFEVVRWSCRWVGTADLGA